MIILYILFALLGQQTTDNGQQTLCTFVAPCTDTLNVSKHIICQQTTDNGQQIKSPSHQVSESPSKCDPNNSVTWRPVDSATYYEYQIHLADSLYKNYLPQYNFDEVKAAVAFFERTTDNSQQTTFSETENLRTSKSEKILKSKGKSQQLSNSTSQNLSVSASQQLSNSASCARAHYSHAVGLTERDDIVGACEHYLRALEIMEIELETENLKTSKSERRLKSKDKRLKKNLRNLKSQNLQVSGTRRLGDSATQPLSNSVTQQLSNSSYEKLRFLALTYTRLGRLFYNENYCDLAITKYRKALKYVEILDNNDSKAYVLKELGNSYQLSNKPDTALYYYNESLRYNSSLPNKLDVEKSIAKILFYQGDKDTSYAIINNNLDKMISYSFDGSYYLILGEMYYEDQDYDNSIKYLHKSINSSNINTKVATAIKLSAIYDSLDDPVNKSYYDNIVANLSVADINNNSVERSKIQSLYNKYEKAKQERKLIRDRKRINIIVSLLSCVIVLSSIITLLVRYKYKRRHKKIIDSFEEREKSLVYQSKIIDQITEEIKHKEKLIQELNFKYSLTEGKIRNKNSELQNKEELIEKYKLEIEELKNKLERNKCEGYNLNNYLQSEICRKIFNEVNELFIKNKDTSELTSLKHGEFVLLLDSANKYLNNVISDIANKYPKLKKDDMYYLSLLITGLNNKQISSLFGVTYAAIRKRKYKICTILGLDIKDNLYKYLLDFITNH